ncbi:hypothetical protein ACIHEJ_02390 [Streptomyces sp. NPDC052301]|uniref:Rv1733c family protein n=1 Tax=Streptomyces sp. NPDC052301 TaxID=3365687 RepID=UPI0037CDA327
MSAGERPRGRLRRRGSDLTRREDLLEAWIVLAVWIVVVVGGAVAGLVAAHAAADVLARQRAGRHAVRAVLLTDAPRDAVTAGAADGRVRAAVRWTAPDATTRTGWTLVSGGLTAGDRVTVWQDGRGRLAPGRPTGPAEGTVEAGLLGAAAALAVAAPACAAGALARSVLDRRRLTAWEREWERTEPRWSHRAD